MTGKAPGLSLTSGPQVRAVRHDFDRAKLVRAQQALRGERRFQSR